MLVKSQNCALDLRPERLEHSRIMNLGKKSRYARSGPTPLQQNCVFQTWSSTVRCNRTIYMPFRSEDSSNIAVTGPCMGQFVRDRKSQHIPDVEQRPYHMRVNLFVRFDNPDVKQHRRYRTVYGSIRFIMYYYDQLRFLFVFCDAFIL